MDCGKDVGCDSSYLGYNILDQHSFTAVFVEDFAVGGLFHRDALSFDIHFLPDKS